MNSWKWRVISRAPAYDITITNLKQVRFWSYVEHIDGLKRSPLIYTTQGTLMNAHFNTSEQATSEYSLGSDSRRTQWWRLPIAKWQLNWIELSGETRWRNNCCRNSHRQNDAFVDVFVVPIRKCVWIWEGSKQPHPDILHVIFHTDLRWLLSETHFLSGGRVITSVIAWSWKIQVTIKAWNVFTL